MSGYEKRYLVPLDIPKPNNGATGHMNASSASPSTSASRSVPDRSQFPPSHSEAKQSMGKRAAQSPIAAPFDKRARGNRSSEVTRTDSPTGPRKNPTSGPSKTPSIDPSRDPRTQGRGPAGLASPIQAASPLSMTNGDAGHYGSGNTTPVQATPFAPPIVPSKLKLPVANGSSRGISSIRQLAGKQQMHSAAASENTAIAQLRAKMIGLENTAKTEKKHFSQLESELKSEREQLAAVSKQLSEVLEKVQRLETQQDPATDEVRIAALTERIVKSVQSQMEADLEERVKKLVQLSIADAQSEIEEHIMQSIRPDSNARDTKITDLADTLRKAEERIDGLESGLEERIKESLESGLSTVESSLSTIETRVDGLDVKNTEVKQLIDGSATTVDLDGVKSQMNKLAENLGSVREYTDGLKKANIVKELATVKKVNDTRIGGLVEDFVPMKNFVDTLKKESLLEQVASLTQKLDVTPHFEPYHIKLLESAVQPSILEDILETVRGEISSSADSLREEISSSAGSRTRQGVLPNVDNNNSSLNAAIANSERKIKGEIGNDIAKIRQAVEDHKKYGDKFNSSTSASLQQLQADITGIRSDVSSAIKQLRSDFDSELQDEIKGVETSTNDAITQMGVNIEELKSATDSDLGKLKTQLKNLQAISSASTNQPRTSRNRSSATPGAGAGTINDATKQELKDEIVGLAIAGVTARLGDLSEDVTKAMETADEAKNLADSLGDIATSIDAIYNPRFGTIEEKVEALEEGVQTLRKQSSVPSQPPVPAQPTPPVSLSREQNDALLVQRAAVNQQANQQVNQQANQQANQQVNQLVAAVQSLQDRYENITTEHVYQNMVHWFQQMYPNAPDLHNRLVAAEGNVRRLVDLADKIHWMGDDQRREQLHHLATNCQGIIERFGNVDSLQHNLQAETLRSNQAVEALRGEVVTERHARESLAQELRPVRAGLSSIINSLEQNTEQQLHEIRDELNQLKPRVETAGNSIAQHEQTLESQQNTIAGLEEFRSSMQELDPHGRFESQNSLNARLQAGLSTALIGMVESQDAITDVNNNFHRDKRLMLTFSRDDSKLRDAVTKPSPRP